MVVDNSSCWNIREVIVVGDEGYGRIIDLKYSCLRLFSGLVSGFVCF